MPERRPLENSAVIASSHLKKKKKGFEDEKLIHRSIQSRADSRAVLKSTFDWLKLKNKKMLRFTFLTFRAVPH